MRIYQLIDVQYRDLMTKKLNTSVKSLLQELPNAIAQFKGIQCHLRQIKIVNSGF